MVHLIKQRMATTVNLFSVERTDAAGLSISGGRVECQSAEDTAHNSICGGAIIGGYPGRAREGASETDDP